MAPHLAGGRSGLSPGPWSAPPARWRTTDGAPTISATAATRDGGAPGRDAPGAGSAAVHLLVGDTGLEERVGALWAGGVGEPADLAPAPAEAVPALVGQLPQVRPGEPGGPAPLGDVDPVAPGRRV